MAYKDGVYDVTDYVKRHPGGTSFIMLAAGSYIEPFMSFYDFHDRSQEFHEALDKYRIGELHPDDRLKEEDIPKYYDVDPRHPVAEKSKIII